MSKGMVNPFLLYVITMTRKENQADIRDCALKRCLIFKLPKLKFQILIGLHTIYTHFIQSQERTIFSKSTTIRYPLLSYWEFEKNKGLHCSEITLHSLCVFRSNYLDFVASEIWTFKRTDRGRWPDGLCY